MLISYIFFNHVGCRKKSAALTIGIGTVLFELGAVIGLLDINALFNAFFSLAANIVFSTVFFGVKKLQGIFYSFMLVVLSSFLELVSILTISTFADIYIANYESQPTLLVIEVIISKIIYFILPVSRNTDKVRPLPVKFVLGQNTVQLLRISDKYLYIGHILLVCRGKRGYFLPRAADFGGDKPFAVLGFCFHLLRFPIQRQKGCGNSSAPAGERQAENRYPLLRYARASEQQFKLVCARHKKSSCHDTGAQSRPGN